MDDLNERVGIVLSESGMSKTDFAIKMDVSLSQLSHISSGRNKPGVELLQKIAQVFPKYSSKWLLTGLGNKFQEQGMSESQLLWMQQAEQKLREIQLDLKALELDIKQKRNEENF